MKIKILGLLVGIAVSTQSFAEFSPLCKATSSQRTFQDAVNLINNGTDVNEPCSNGFKGGLPLDMVIQNAAINSKAPELAALLLSKGAVVGGYRKDVFLFLDPKRQQEFDTKAIAAPFAITPAETEYTMRKWKEYIDHAQEMSNAEFRERARKQDAATFAAIGAGVAAAAGAAVTYEVMRNSGSDKAATAILNQTSNRFGKATSGSDTARSSPTTTSNAPSITTSPSSANFAASANASQDQSWKQCGPVKRCLVGDGYQQFCSGPFDPSKPMCKSECSMDSLVIYHDTTLAPGAYIPGNGKCPARSCNVINSCG